METLTIHSKLNDADWRVLCLAAGARMQQAARRNWFDRSAPLMTWLIITATMVFLFNTSPPLIRPMGAMILIGAIGLFWWWVARLRMKQAGPHESGVFLGDQTFEFSAAGFRASRAHSETMNQWSLVRDIGEGESHLFLWIDRMSAYVVPARDLPASMTIGSLAALLRGFKEAAMTPATAAGIGSPLSESVTVPASGPAPAEAPAPSTLRELGALVRLFGWGKPDPEGLQGRELTLALLGTSTLALWIGLDRLNFDGEVAFAVWGMSAIAVAFAEVMILAWLLARFSTPRLELRKGMLLILGLAPLLAIACWVVNRCPQVAVFTLLGVLGVECSIYLKRGLRAMSGARQIKALLLTVTVGALMAYESQQLWMMAGFWFEPDANYQVSEEDTRRDEQLVFEQSSRIDELVAAMRPREPGKTNVYFVGFAGYGDQRVFAQEIDLAARTVGARYSAQPRSLQLVNDSRNGTRHPFASPSSLRHALKQLASRMDLDEDVLFLSLSSHGSEDARVSVSSEYGYWSDLEASQLAGMLRDSGIRLKVIVISACYAGSFIEALKDENTIILTAAAADRTSFGCADDSELTYFGEAFYQDALPSAANLKAAFEKARAEIAEREDAEGLKPSNPQAFFGEKVLDKMSALEPWGRAE